VSDPQLSPHDVRRGLDALVDELVELGATSHIQVVGGAAVMIQAGRESLSRDIDALYAPSPNIDEAIRAVAMSNNWAETWLNDAVNMYASNYDNDEDWEIHIARAGVTVSVAKCPLLLAMKLLAGRSRDIDDISLLLAACGITERQGAVDVFDHYYPNETMKQRALRILDDLLPGTH
jgi:hypothetical protein